MKQNESKQRNQSTTPYNETRWIFFNPKRDGVGVAATATNQVITTLFYLAQKVFIFVFFDVP